MLSACGDDLELISVKRNAVIEFHVNGAEASWKSRTIRVIPGPSVAKTVGDPAQTLLFKRYFMIAEGTSPDKQSFELTLTFDIAANGNDMRHHYTSVYNTQGGIESITLIIKTNNQYTVRELCTAAPDVFFEIERQSNTEKLISGSFNGELCVDGITDAIIISDATFRDIQY